MAKPKAPLTPEKQKFRDDIQSLTFWLQEMYDGTGDKFYDFYAGQLRASLSMIDLAGNKLPSKLDMMKGMRKAGGGNLRF